MTRKLTELLWELSNITWLYLSGSRMGVCRLILVSVNDLFKVFSSTITDNERINRGWIEGGCTEKKVIKRTERTNKRLKVDKNIFSLNFGVFSSNKQFMQNRKRSNKRSGGREIKRQRKSFNKQKIWMMILTDFIGVSALHPQTNSSGFDTLLKKHEINILFEISEH